MRSARRSWGSPAGPETEGSHAGRLHAGASRPRHHARDLHGRGHPGERGRRAGRDHPTDARGGRRLRDGRADRAWRGADHGRPRRGPGPVPRGRLVGGPSAGAPRGVPLGRHVPEPLDVRGDEPGRRRPPRARTGARGRSRRLLGPRFGGAARRRHVPGGPVGGRRGAHDGRPRPRRRDAPPTACAGRPAITPRARCTAATASSTTPRSRPKPSRSGPASASRSSTSTTTTATAASRSSGGGATCGTSRSTPTRSGPTRTSWVAPTRPARATGAGENLNIPLRAGATNEDYLEATDRAVEAIAAVPGLDRRRLARASTPTASTRSATSR